MIKNNPHLKKLLSHSEHQENHFNRKDFLLFLIQEGMLPYFYRLPTSKRYFTKNATYTIAYFHHLKHTMQHHTHLLAILQASQKHHITLLPFKGTSLSFLLFGSPLQRQTSDIDLLVQKEQLPLALTLLKEESYELEAPFHRYPISKLMHYLTVLTLRHKHSGVIVELHWELFSYKYAISWQTAPLFQEAYPIQEATLCYKTLPLTPYLLYLVTHAFKHRFERLSWLYDIDQYLRHLPLEPNKLLQEAKDKQLTTTLLSTLALTHHYFQTPLPQILHEKIEHPTIQRMTTLLKRHIEQPQKTYTPLRHLLFLLPLQEGLFAKVKLLYASVYSLTAEDIKASPLPSSFFFLYPLLRPFRLLFASLKRMVWIWDK